ncbi:hypothetical protein ACS0TY_012878 [Phlomoides rotata]
MSSGFEGLQSLFNPTKGSFLQPRTNFLYDSKKSTPYPEQVYVSPIMKSSSLEMCNETLGNESGSNIDPNLDEYSYLMLENMSCEQRKPRKYCKKNDVFPPPLSSMNGIKVEARREGGRLVITASNFRAIYFKSERENGRLRMFLVQKKIDDKVEKDGEKLGCKREVGQFFGSSKKIPSLSIVVTFS